MIIVRLFIWTWFTLACRAFAICDRDARRVWLGILLVLAAAVSLEGCATVETGADRVRDFAAEHPVITAIAAGAAAGALVAAVDRPHHHEHHRELARTADYGLRTHTCAPVPHGDVELPPGGGAEVCR